jgi:hypothetical protein
MIHKIAKEQANKINKIFSLNIEQGKKALLSSITDYANLLKKQSSGFNPNTSINYRNYITNIVNEIEEPYKNIALSEVLVPSKITISLQKGKQ